MTTGWNRSGKWVVVRTHHNRMRLEIVWPEGGPQGKDLAALRNLVPSLGAKPPAEIKAMVAGGSRIKLGVLGHLEGVRMKAAAEVLGLTVEAADASVETYLAQDEESSASYSSADGFEAERVCKDMIAAGVPVRDEESD